jgi:hypothetical protein
MPGFVIRNLPTNYRPVIVLTARLCLVGCRSEVGGSRGEGGLAGVGAQLLGPGGLESLKSKGLGLLERISSARAAAGAAGGAQAGQGGEPATLEDIGNMLKVGPHTEEQHNAHKGRGAASIRTRPWKLSDLVSAPLSSLSLSSPSLFWCHPWSSCVLCCSCFFPSLLPSPLFFHLSLAIC